MIGEALAHPVVGRVAGHLVERFDEFLLDVVLLGQLMNEQVMKVVYRHTEDLASASRLAAPLEYAWLWKLSVLFGWTSKLAEMTPDGCVRSQLCL